MKKLQIRNVRPEDLAQVAAIEACCFPPAEAASSQALAARMEFFPESFLVAEAAGTLIGFINGGSTDSPVIYDALFSSVKEHNPQGKNQAVFGLDVIPDYRCQGIAGQLMKEFIRCARDSGKQNIILTCKDHLVHYYESFGYVNSGLSASKHGGAEWFDMTLSL